MTSTDVADRLSLKAAGLRITTLRLAALRAVGDLPHAETGAVVARVRADLGTASVQAVYDALHALARAGLLRRTEPAGHPARYERRTGDNHHHVVCRGCGAMADVDCAVGTAPCLEPSNASGFIVDVAEVTFWGLCPECAAPSGSPADHDEGAHA